MAITRKFTVEELEEEYDLPYGAVYEDTVDKRRWYSVLELVFLADDGKHYMVDYMDPATEQQEGQERWYEDSQGLVEAILVEPKEVITVQWVAVNA
jgi:hypothetical protein